MRLICPNCDAEYEVDASVIPEGGRDVQCSNCGHAWFQLPPEVEAAEAAEAALFDAPPPLVPSADVDTLEAVAAEPEAFPEEDPAPPRRQIDESLLSVLREEAEREVEQRRHEAPPVPIETQDELPLVASSEAVPPVVEEAAPAVQEERRAKGRDLLPDIEEINSTLRPSGVPRNGETMPAVEILPEEPTDGRGFRTGFMLMLILALIIVGLYAMAPRISGQLPALAPTLDAFVAAVDGGRLWIDGLMKATISAINGTPPRS